MAEPIIASEVARIAASASALGRRQGLVLVTCAVCRDFMRPSSPYRLNPDIRLASVPCLIR